MKTDALELLTSGKTEQAIEVLLKETQSNGTKSELKQLLLLKSNFRKTKRQMMLGLISNESQELVITKTNQFLIDFVKGDNPELDSAGLKPQLKGFIKILLSGVSLIMLFYAVLLFYLRRDIIDQWLFQNNSHAETYLLIFPTFLFLLSIYCLIKIRKYA